MRRLATLVAIATLAASCTETVRDFPATPARTTAAPTTTVTPSPGASASRPPSTSPTPSRTPAGASPSPATSAQPTIPPGASLPALPAQPPLASGVAPLTTGTLSFALPAGATARLDATELARSRGVTIPAGAFVVWTLAWRATEPLTSAWYRDAARSEIGRGRWGTADLGNGAFELRNDGAATVYGELAYSIGTR